MICNMTTLVVEVALGCLMKAVGLGDDQKLVSSSVFHVSQKTVFKLMAIFTQMATCFFYGVDQIKNL